MRVVSLVVCVAMTLTLRPVGEAQTVIRSSTGMVRVFATVSDNRGESVGELTRDNFTVWDNGNRQYLSLFSHERQSLSAALVLDLSGSMKRVSDAVLSGARDFASALLPGDRAAVTALWKPSLRFTTDGQDLSRQIESLTFEGDSPIWDTVERAVAALKREPEPRLLVVFTDGRDTRYSAPRTLSQVYGPDIIARRIRDVGIRIVFVSFEDTAGEFEQAVDKADGQLMRPKSPSDLSTAFRTALVDLHNAYLLGFAAGTDGKRHTIDVKVDRKNVTVRSRKSYVAGR